MARSWSDIGPGLPNQNVLSIEGFGIDKLATPILERPARWRAQDTALAPCIREVPLVGGWIVQTKRQGFNVTCRAIGFCLP